MQITPIALGSSVSICDAELRTLGVIRVAETKYGAYCGVFEPAPDFGRCASLFEELDEIVSQQSLTHVDEIEERVRRLGLVGFCETKPIQICDVQIWNDRKASFRVADWGSGRRTAEPGATDNPDDAQ